MCQTTKAGRPGEKCMLRLFSTSQHLFSYLMVLLATTLFGLSGTFSRLLFDDGVSPVTLVEFRMLIGFACLFTVLILGQRQLLRFAWRYWSWVILFGLSLALVIYFYFMAISRLPLAVAVVMQFSATAWMTLGRALWQRRWPSVLLLASLSLTFGGVLLITGIWQQNLNHLDSLGLFYAVLTMLTYIAYLMLGRRVGKDIPAPSSTMYGSLIAGLFWLVVQPPWSIPVSTWIPRHLILILLVGVIGMALPFSLILASLRRLEATRVGMVSTFEIVSTAVIAYFWLGQGLTLWQVLGCLFVLSGIVLLNYEKTELREQSDWKAPMFQPEEEGTSYQPINR